MTDVTVVKIEPDWSMLFLDDEVTISAHNITILDTIEAVDGVDIGEVTRHRVQKRDVDEIDDVEYLGQLPPVLEARGPGILEDQ